MNRSASISKPLLWCTAILLASAASTLTAQAAGPAPVVLGTAGNFAILAKSGISTVPASAVTGDIGVSPISQTAITGFSQTLDASNTFSTSTQVTGKIYAADYAPPTPTYLTTAVSDMQTAYTDAAGRTLPGFTELGAGEIGGLTLVPGLYKWGTGVLISTSVTLSGGPNDVWIFQIAGGLTQAAATNVNLTGGARPQNIFWQTFGAVAIGTTAHFEGIVLSQTSISVGTGASVNGRLLAQTAVTLNQNTVTQPASGPPPSSMSLPTGPTQFGCVDGASGVFGSADPAAARPLGAVNVGGDIVLQLGFVPFTAPVDIYQVAQLPSGEQFIMNSLKQWLPFPANTVPYRAGSASAVNFDLLWQAPRTSIPAGAYVAYTVVVAAGTDPATFNLASSSYYLWCTTRTLP